MLQRAGRLRELAFPELASGLRAGIGVGGPRRPLSLFREALCWSSWTAPGDEARFARLRGICVLGFVLSRAF